MTKPEGTFRARVRACEGATGKGWLVDMMKATIFGQGVLAATAFAVAIFASIPHAKADGAFAIGYSGDIAKDGVSYGYSANNAKPDEAAESALRECRVGQNAPKMATLCKIAMTFRNECMAVAWDPQTGTPGMGIAFAADKSTAEARAVELCKVSAGQGRQGSCQIDKAVCDVTRDSVSR